MISERRRTTRIILPVIARTFVSTLATGPVIARPVLPGILLTRRLGGSLLCRTFLSWLVLGRAFLTGPVVAWPVLTRPLLASPFWAGSFLAGPFLAGTILVRPSAARSALGAAIGAALGLRCLLGTCGRGSRISGDDGRINGCSDGQ